MNDQSVHFSSSSDAWATPKYIWQFMEHVVGRFKLDAAAEQCNAICKRFLGPGSSIAADALTAPWLEGPVWLNPPYSNVEAFMAKALQESQQGGGNGCLFSTSPHRHRLVAQIRNQRGDYVPPRSSKVWGWKELRPLPQCNSNL